jgi:hypothetical protein
MNKTSKIAKSTFSNEWTNPSGGTTFYYDIVFTNGDSGSVGVQDKLSDNKIKVGKELNYEIINGKIKVNQMSNTPKTDYSSNKTYSKPKTSQEQMLGYAWSYAKDFIVAGKTMSDVEELNQVARYIYNQIGDMLNGNDEAPY